MVSVSKAALSLALSLLGKVSPRNGPFPLISQLRLSASAGVLLAQATDLEVFAEVRVPADGELRPSLASPEKLSACAAAAPGKGKAKAAALVSLDNASGSSTLDVASGGRKWTLHANGQAVDFPEKNPAPEGEARAFCPDAERLVGVLDFVSPAVCTDETRFNLCGLLLDGTSVVATDGPRLHMERLPAGLPVGWRPILPMSAVRMLRAAATLKGARVELRFYRQGSHTHTGIASVSLPGNCEVSIQFKTIDGTFPDYTHVIPARPEGVVTVEADALREAFAVVKKFAKSSQGTTRVSINGAVEISTDNPDDGRFAETVATDGHSSLDSTVGINAGYACSALDGFEGQPVTVGYGDSLCPLLFTYPAVTTRVAVIMPVRI